MECRSVTVVLNEIKPVWRLRSHCACAVPSHALPDWIFPARLTLDSTSLSKTPFCSSQQSNYFLPLIQSYPSPFYPINPPPPRHLSLSGRNFTLYLFAVLFVRLPSHFVTLGNLLQLSGSVNWPAGWLRLPEVKVRLGLPLAQTTERLLEVMATAGPSTMVARVGEGPRGGSQQRRLR